MPYTTLPYPVSRSPSPSRLPSRRTPCSIPPYPVSHTPSPAIISYSDISELALPSPLLPVDPRPLQSIQLIGLKHSAYTSYIPPSGPSSPLFYPQDPPNGPPSPTHDYFGDKDYPPRSLLLTDSLIETLHTALSIDIVDELGIVVILPPTFSRPPQWETTPYSPDPSPKGEYIELLAYGPNAGVNPKFLSDAAFMIEIRDEAKLVENIGEGLTFRSLRHMLEAYYELLYGSS